MGLRYEMSFDDRQGRRVDVRIYRSDWSGAAERLTGGASPLVLQEDDSEGIDTPSRGWTGHLTVWSGGGADLSGLFAAEVTDVRVEVWTGGALVWQGFVVPEVMRQSWIAKGEELTFNVQSPLEALSGLTLEASRGFGIVTLAQLVGECSELAGGAWDEVAVPVDVMLPGTAAARDPLLMARVARYAFFSREADESDFDDTQTPVFRYVGRSGREVLEAVARLAGWTALERGRRLIFAADGVSTYEVWQTEGLASGRYDTYEEPAPASRLVESLTAAGADHTLSLNPGCRRVRVAFTPAVEDELLGGANSRAWPATGAVDFEEDIPCSKDGEEGGYYVIPNKTPFEATGAAQFTFGGYAMTSADGLSRASLYEVRRDGEIQSWYLSGEKLAALPQHWTWASEGTTYDDTAFIGAATAWAVWRKAMAVAGGTESTATEGQLTELGETRRRFGFLFWNTVNRGYYRYTLQNPGYVIEEMAGREIIHLSSTPEMIFPGGALKLSAKFSAFYGYGDATEPGTGPVGPITVRRGGRITDWTFALQVGDYWYNGASWQQQECTFTVELVSSGEDDTSAEYAELKPTERAADARKYQEGDDGFIIPIADADADELMLTGRVGLTLYFRASADPTNTAARFSPIHIYDLALEHLRPVDEGDPYASEGETAGTHYYIQPTGARFDEDVREAELELGTWNGDRAAYNLLFDAMGQPVLRVSSLRQLGREDRPERLVCRNMARLYGRTTRRLTLEVDAAGLDPRAPLADAEGRSYALGGVEWDVREAACRYTLEDFTPWTEWEGA